MVDVWQIDYFGNIYSKSVRIIFWIEKYVQVTSVLYGKQQLSGVWRLYPLVPWQAIQASVTIV